MRRINFQLFAMGTALALSSAATAETGKIISKAYKAFEKPMLRLRKNAPWAGASHGDFEILKS